MNNKEVMGNMLSVIKTAMVTIIISFTSGVLLDLYKNVAPRIVCKMTRCKKTNKSDSNVKEYILNIKNVSKKTIHNLDIHVQSEALCESFKVHDEKITYGLKYDMSEEENIYSINIPFLSKNDEFSAKLVLEDSHNAKNKPIVMLRSPDNFKRVDSLQYKLQSGTNIFNKKILIAIVLVILIMFTGVIASNLLNKTTKDIEGPAIETSDEEAINSEEKPASSETSSNANKKTSSKSNANNSVDKNANTSTTVIQEEKSEESKESSSSTTNEQTTSNTTDEGKSQESTSSNKEQSSDDGKIKENTNINSNTTNNNSSTNSSSNSNANVSNNTTGTNSSTSINDSVSNTATGNTGSN